MIHISIIVMCIGAGFYLWKSSAVQLNGKNQVISISIVMVGAVSCHFLAIEQLGFGHQYYVYVMLGMLLLILGVVDFHTYLLPMELLTTGYIFCSILLLADRSEQWYMAVIAAAVGFGLVYGTGKLFGGGIGEGDAHVVALLILGLGWTHGLFVLLLALLLSAVTGIWMMIIGGKSRKTMLPFIPFIAVAHIGILLF